MLRNTVRGLGSSEVAFTGPYLGKHSFKNLVSHLRRRREQRQIHGVKRTNIPTTTPPLSEKWHKPRCSEDGVPKSNSMNSIPMARRLMSGDPPAVVLQPA
jgi:hypothetical protein